MMKRKKKPGLSAREKRIAEKAYTLGLYGMKGGELVETQEELFELCEKAARSGTKPKKKGRKS